MKKTPALFPLSIMLACTLTVSCFVGSSAAVANELSFSSDLPLTEAQRELARKLAAEAGSAVPGEPATSSLPKPRPRPTLSAMSGTAPPINSGPNLAITEAVVLMPPARLSGANGDIPLRRSPSETAQIEKIIRGITITSEVMMGDWYLVVLNTEFFFVNRKEVQPAPR